MRSETYLSDPSYKPKPTSCAYCVFYCADVPADKPGFCDKGLPAIIGYKRNEAGRLLSCPDGELEDGAPVLEEPEPMFGKIGRPASQGPRRRPSSEILYQREYRKAVKEGRREVRRRKRDGL